MKNNAFGGKKQNKKSNGEQSGPCDHSFKPTIAWPVGCKYGTIAWYGEIVSEKAPS